MTEASLISAVLDIVTPRLKRLESLHDGDTRTAVLEPMQCPVGVWTVGYGHALTRAGRQLRGAGDRDAAFAVWRQRWPKGMTLADADRLLDEDARRVIGEVLAELRQPLAASPGEVAAMTLLTYNIGLDGFRGSTVLKQHNAGNRKAAARAFALWNKGTVDGQKKILPGLVTRREEEAALYEGAVQPAPAVSKLAPRAVEEAGTMKPLAQSRSIKAAQLGGGLAAITTVASELTPVVQQVRDAGATIRSLVDVLPSPAWIVAAILGATLVYLVWRHVDDHRQQQAG